MSRRVAWVSAGAASAIAAKLGAPDVLAYCETAAEDADNARFLHDVERWIGMDVVRLKSERYRDTWDVWEQERYMAGIYGAPCTRELKRIPRENWQHADDIHIFGYTADAADVRRAAMLRENWPEMCIETPLIERGLTKEGCLAMLSSAGIQPPRVYAMGLQNANCIPCVKATSPSYWALVRREFPAEFRRAAEMSRRLGVRLTRLSGSRAHIDEIPADHSTTNPISPACDMLCQMAEMEMSPGGEG